MLQSERTYCNVWQHMFIIYIYVCMASHYFVLQQAAHESNTTEIKSVQHASIPEMCWEPVQNVLLLLL